MGCGLFCWPHEGTRMPAPVAVQGYTGLTQQTQLVLENNQSAPGEPLLMPLTNRAATMSLTTQPNTLSPTTGMHLHFLIIGATTSGTVVVAGTTISGGAQTSATYHPGVAPQNGQGYTVLTTSEIWGTANANGITITGLTNSQILVYGS